MRKVVLLSLLFSGLITFGQNEVESIVPLNDNRADLKTQHAFILENSRTYVNNKVVKTEWLNQFYENATDSLKNAYATINQIEQNYKTEKIKVGEIQLKLEEAERNFSDVNEEKDNITLLGSPTSKGTYKTIMWSAVIVLFALLLFFLYKFKNSSNVTKEAKENLRIIEAELADTKKKMRTREQELMRKLQDEINKNT